MKNHSLYMILFLLFFKVHNIMKYADEMRENQNQQQEAQSTNQEQST
jgi:hypothetical protein